MNDPIHNTLAESVERRREDAEFQSRLRRNIERHKDLLDLLADR